MEKRFIGFVTALLVSGLSFPVFSLELTLDECIAIALNENPSIKVADMEIVKADYSKKETVGALLPGLSFDGSYSRTLKKQVTYMDFDAFGDFGGLGGDNTSGDGNSDVSSRSGSDEGFKVGLDNMYSLGFQLSLPIVAPQLWQSVKLSDVQIAMAAEQARASRLDMVNQVKNAFYALLLAYDSKNVVQESYDMAQLTHSIYKKRLEAGDASEYDVLRTSVAMKNIEPELIQCDIAIRRAHLQLTILMGIEASTDFSIAGSLADYDTDSYEDLMNGEPDLTNNSSLLLNDIQTLALERTVKLQKSAWWPTLALGANYNWNSSSNGSPFKNFRWTPYSMVGLSLSIPIFQGGQRYNRIKQAQIELDQLDWTRENLTRSILSQAILARDNINLNIKQIASSKESVGEAERAHSIQERSFEIGAASYLELRDSELSLTRARLGYYQAMYNYMVATSDLELLLGNAPIDQYSSQQYSIPQ